ncbi:MAG: phage major capsid protein [Phycisphaeraceae bacterium]|nr:phage major capsid protein [Phycisphaeraceae bacterium]
MNRKQFLEMLRKQHGYAGKADLAEVKAFVNDPENGFNFVDAKGKALDLDAIWAKTVTVAISADNGEDVEVSQSEGSEVNPGASNSSEQPPTHAASLASRGKSVGANAGIHFPKVNYSLLKSKKYNQAAARGETAFSDADIAADFGTFVKKIFDGGNKLAGKAQTLGTTTAGGHTVPTEVFSDLISNRANVGVLRKLAKYYQIPRDKANIPTRTGGLTVYAPGEASAITASDMTFGVCAFDAALMATLTAVSVELMHDSVLDIGAVIGDEINHAFAAKEDEIAFAPVGTGTTFGMVSIPRAIYNQVVSASGTWTTDAHKLYHPGVTIAAGNAWSEITLANLISVPGKLPDYAHDGAAWVVSQAFWGQVMLPLALTAAGTVASEVINGVKVPMFLGYPVFRTSKMPTAEANSQICALFGNFSRTVGLADVKEGMSIDIDYSLYFNLAAVAIRGMQRSSIVPFDVGTANATPASQVASPMCALATLNA